MMISQNPTHLALIIIQIIVAPTAAKKASFTISFATPAATAAIAQAPYANVTATTAVTTVTVAAVRANVRDAFYLVHFALEKVETLLVTVIIDTDPLLSVVDDRIVPILMLHLFLINSDRLAPIMV